MTTRPRPQRRLATPTRRLRRLGNPAPPGRQPRGGSTADPSAGIHTRMKEPCSDPSLTPVRARRGRNGPLGGNPKDPAPSCVAQTIARHSFAQTVVDACVRTGPRVRDPVFTWVRKPGARPGLSCPGFRGGSETRIRSSSKELRVHAQSQEVSRGADRAWCAAGARVGPAGSGGSGSGRPKRGHAV